MANSPEEAPPNEPRKQPGAKKARGVKGKGHDALVGRVKKVVKKSRRKLSEEKFKKELQRTIAFLEQLRAKIAEPHDGQPAIPAQPDALAGVAPAPAAEDYGKKGKKDKHKKKHTAAARTAVLAQSEAPGD